MDWNESIVDFFSQPFGVFGSICIMGAITCFNSQNLKKRLTERLGDASLNIMLNGLNALGGVCLLVNACIRDEIVWKVMETYFVAISLKGVYQELGKRKNSPKT